MIIENDQQFMVVKIEHDYHNSVFAFLQQESNIAGQIVQKDKHNLAAQNILSAAAKDIEMLSPIVLEMRLALNRYQEQKYEKLKPLTHPNFKLPKN